MRHGGGGYDTSDTFSDAPTSDDDSCHIGGTASRAYRTHRVRRKSVAPPGFRLNNDDIEYSPQHSVTSINSIASLLREKLMMTLPYNRRKKPNSEFHLRFFVGFLFLLIVFTVSFAHVYYYQQVLQREYFPYTRFNKEAKFLRLYSNEGVEIALGHLGVDLPDTDRVYHCRPENVDNDGSLCFEWMDHARIKLHHVKKSGNLNCYYIRWYSLSDSINPTDCYEDGYQYGHWYGGGRTLGMAWPVELGRVEMSPFITGHIGHHRWGLVLKRYFINSKGVAITVDPQSPLYVSINADKNRLCLRGQHDHFTYRRTNANQPTLNYTVCTSSNMKSLHLALSEKSLWDGLKKSDLEVIYSLLTEPVWQIAPKDKQMLTDTAIVNFTENVIALGYFRQGHVLLNEFWQTEIGDFTFDEERFATIKETIDIIQRRGFRIILTIQPFVGTESINFAELVEKNLLINERGSEKNRQIPALTSYKSLRSAGMLDITNNETRSWLQGRMRQLFESHKVDALCLDLGSAYDLPRYYQFKNNLTNPDHYKVSFTDCVLAAVPVLAISSTISRPPAPVFLSLPSLQSSWESLQVIIPTTLTYGIVGYPFLMPGPVGGDYVSEMTKNHKANETLDIFSDVESTNELPDRELYIRWLQLATFLPVIRFSYLPSQYDKEVIDLAKNLTALRQQKVNPLLQKYVKDALETGIPLIRPLWMLDPADTTCHTVKDEFCVGEELIVAPMLRPKSTMREVYLPAGVWQDGIDGSLRKGSRWLHHYRASLNQVPYFIRMPDNTRF
ncbi:myogenesis-regulating glycosidase isoform X2 [Planococcus citri]